MRRPALGLAVLVSLVAFSWSRRADAQAQVYLSQANIPAGLNENGLRNFLRGHQARRVDEESDHRTWKFKVGTFFRSPPGDLEAHLLFYDVEHGSRLFVTEMTVFLSSREETAFLQNVTLTRPQFKPQNRYIVVLTVRRNEMASVNFELIGQVAERTGVVEFSDSETADPDQVAANQQNAAAEQQRIAAARQQAREQEYQQAMRERQAAGGSDTSGGEEGDGEDGDPASGHASEGGCASCRTGGAAGGSGSAVLAVVCVGLALARRRLS